MLVNADPALSRLERWTAAKFPGRPDTQAREPNLLPRTKGNRLEKNQRRGRKLLIAGTKFERGIVMPTTGEVVVQLPSPGAGFQAMVGVDSNDAGYYLNAGRGSVILSVLAEGRELFRSEVLSEGAAAVPVRVPLNGARQFTLRLEAVGQHGKTWQQEWDMADWADARVELATGGSIWLDELPVGPMPENFSAALPFSFRYNGRSSTEFLPQWKLARSSRPLDRGRTELTSTYTDPETGLSLRAVAVTYADSPLVEWTLHFRNEGSADTPVLEEIQPLDATFERTAGSEFVLHHFDGSPNSPTDYRPHETPLAARSETRFVSRGGRPTDTHLSYFNLESAGGGIIVAIGWPGQWTATFHRDDARHVRIRAGQELTHFRLHAGEEVRTPLIALEFYDGDWIDGQNVWRRWMIRHNLPRPHGKLPPPQLAGGTNRYTIEMQDATEANQLGNLKSDLDAGIPLDYWWMDAGWYPFQKGWWEVGTWVPDPVRFPRGFAPISAAAHERGVKTIVWFEPERVVRGSWLEQNHPEWLIGKDGSDKLLYLGNPAALEWLTGHVSGLLKENGIDLYRQDFNFEPLARWRFNDTEDRQGISEIKHITGYLAYWDELRRRFPNLLIDTCASGGRRNDLETLRRSVPLWRSDYVFEMSPMQQFTYGMSFWIPYFGTGVNSLDPYVFRSQMTPAIGIGMDLRRVPGGYARFRRLVDEWRSIAPYYYGDYYPLTPYSTDDTAWLGWQFHLQEKGEGLIQIFRRPRSPFESARLPLRGLDAAARYVVKNVDTGEERTLSGEELLRRGLPVTAAAVPQALLLTYKTAR
ncbi:MAG: alpha-galactosidase [Acidobacteria bacterium]|nr:alpha-galactosidase [Acidobacteriota bacterium]